MATKKEAETNVKENTRKVTFEDTKIDKVNKRFSKRISNKEDKDTLDEAAEALAWLSLVDKHTEEEVDGKKKDEQTNQTQSKGRYQNRTSHRSKKGWDRFFCSL